MASKKEVSEPVDFTIFDVKAGAEAGYDLEILTPSGKPSGVVFKILGKDSSKYQDLALELSRKRVEAVQKTGRAQDFDLYKADADALLAAITVGWSSFILDGEPLECSAKNAFKIYSDPRFAGVREQVEVAVNNRANFTKA